MTVPIGFEPDRPAAAPAGFEPHPVGFEPSLEHLAMWPSHAPTANPAASDLPVQDEGIGPLELLVGAGTFKPGLAAANGLTKAAPWLVQAMTRGGLLGAGQGAIHAAAMGHENPTGDVLGGAAGGAVFGPAVEAIGGAIGPRLAALRRGRAGAPPPAAPPAPVVSPVETPAAAMPVKPHPEMAPAEPVTVQGVPSAAPEPAVAPEMAAPEPTPGAAPPATGGAPPPATVGPVDVNNRQQFPLIEDIRATIKDDPEYAKRLAALGGGQPVANSETLAKAVEAGPMHPDELAAWPMGAPVDHVTQTRGLMTFDYFQQKWLRSVAEYDGEGAGQALEEIRRLLPGVENMGGEAGRTLQARGMFVRDELWRAMQDLQDLQAKGVPLEQAAAAAREIQARAAAAIGPKPSAPAQSLLDKITTAATFMKLTSPVTHAVNTISNALTFAARPLEKAGTAAAYLLQGNKAAAQSEVDYLFGTTMGFRNGLQRYVSTLMDDAAAAGGAAAEVHSKNIPLPRALRPFDVFRQLSAADGFWKGVLEDARLHELASRAARAEGLSGEALAAKVSQYVEARPNAWVAEAQKYAKEFTFQEDPDRLLKAVQGIQSLPFVKFFVPFVQTPYNLAKFQFQRSAAGVLSPRNLTGLRAGGQQQAEAVGRLTAGLGLSAGALALVSSTPTTGDYPKDPRERARWRAERIQPYSIQMPNGTWVNYSRFAPVGLYIGQAVMLRDALQNGDQKTADEMAAALAASSIKQVGDMPFLSDMSNLFDAFRDPEKKAGSFVQGVATGFVPNILRDVRQQVDPNVRVARGIGPAMENMVPGLSSRLPKQVDVLGRDVTYEPNRLLRATKVMSTRRTDPESQLLGELDWAPSPVEDVLKKKGHPDVKLKPDQYERFQREVGEARAATIRRLMSRSSFSGLDDDEKKDRLDKATKEAAATVRDRWKRELFNHRSRGAAQEVAR